jgi:lipooligosaccharide transport system ATP-binding protein
MNEVVKRFGSFTAVDRVSLDIPRGRCYALLGPNGAGKTTVTKMVGGMLRRDGGELFVLGRDPWAEQSEVKARLGVVQQKDSLDEELNVQDNLEIYGRFFWLGGRAFRKKVAELLAFMALDGRERMPIHALSGGMKRRLVIARALLNDPEMLLLDEPTTGLDPQVRQTIWASLRKLKNQGMTILLTTHYMSEAAHLADRVAIMDQGRLIAEDTTRGLVAAHLPAYVLEFDTVDEQHGIDGLRDRASTEVHGDRAYVFHDDEKPLREWINEFGFRTAILRPSSLEDVFLKLTGRGLHE